MSLAIRGHFVKAEVCKKSSVKVEKVLVQYKETEGQVDSKSVGLVLDIKR